MGNPFQDQLLKAGLVSEQQVKQTRTAKNKQARQHRGKKEEAVDEIRLQAERARQKKAERDRELNRQKLEQAQQKQIAAQIRQLIEMNRVDIRDGEVAYNFEDDKVVRRIFVSDQVQKQIINGSLTIARLDGKYEVVPRPVADKIRQRNPDCIVVSNDKESQVAEDDPYAEYQIPDDLMW